MKTTTRTHLPHLLPAILIALISGCCNDPNSPVIELVGPKYLTVIKGKEYVEQGATARDIEDGDLTSAIEISGATQVSSDNVGEYIITYSVSDDCDNMDMEQRVINVSYASSLLVDTLDTEFMTVVGCTGDSDTSYYNQSNRNLFELVVLNFDPKHFRDMVLMDIKGDSVVINEQFNSTEDTTISGFGIFVQDDVLDFKYTISCLKSIFI